MRVVAISLLVLTLLSLGNSLRLSAHMQIYNDLGNTLRQGTTMVVGDRLSSGNGYFLCLQVDGNLVLYQGDNPATRRALWASNTVQFGRELSIQSNGQLILRATSNTPVWSSNKWVTTGGYFWQPYRLVMQTDGNLVVYGVNSQPLWATGTVGGRAVGRM